jgi:hypothetical protein
MCNRTAYQGTPTEMPRTPKYNRCIAEKYGRARKGKKESYLYWETRKRMMAKLANCMHRKKEKKKIFVHFRFSVIFI